MNASLSKRFRISGAICLWLLIGFGVSVRSEERVRVISVSTVKELYAAVNNSANRDVTVRLAPGTYVLSTLQPSGAVRPNRGALRMPPGMSLIGSEQRIDTDGDGVPDPISAQTPDNFTVPGTETIVDGAALDLPFEPREDCEGQPFSAPNPVIHVGVDNSIAHLTLEVGSHVGISEPTNNPVNSNGSLSMEVSNTVLRSSGLAMGFSNTECAARRARSVLIFSHNVVSGAGFIGLFIANLLTGDAGNSGTDGPAIWATVTSNLFYGNRKALVLGSGNKGSDGGQVTLYMARNVFRDNIEGNLQAAAAGGGPFPAIGNRLKVRSEFDTFGESLSSVALFAGEVGATDARGNTLEAEFYKSRFIRDKVDTPAEISIFGGDGGHNYAKVLIRRASVTTSGGSHTQGAIVIQDDSELGVGSSTARLEGERREFIQSNQGLPAPPAHFFREHQ